MAMGLRAFLFALLFIPMIAEATPVCVTVARANLRGAPNAKGKVTWTVGKYMPFKKLETKGPWSKVADVDGETHWIETKNISSRLQCVVVKAKVANLRRAPASSADPAEIPIADKYTPFKKLERDGAWLRIEDSYKEKFWVSDTNMWWPVNRASISF